MNDKFGHIKEQVDQFAKVINAPRYLLPTYGNSTDARPNIELSDTGALSYEEYERGQCTKLEYALNLDHLLYMVFRDITYQMALEYAAQYSDRNVDGRRTEFDYQLELLGKLKKDWQRKEEQHQKAILMQFPFKDYLGKKQAYLRELLGSGFLYNEAVGKVNQKYP